MDIDWNVVGAIGEMVGAVAVVFTIGYLAIQVRYARRSLATDKSVSVAQTYVSLLQRNSDQNRALLEVLPLIRKSDAGEELTDAELERVFVYFIEMENLWLAFKTVSKIARYDLDWEQGVR